MALKLKGTLGSVTSGGLVLDDGVRDMSAGPEPYAMSDREVVRIMAERQAQVVEEPEPAPARGVRYDLGAGDAAFVRVLMRAGRVRRVMTRNPLEHLEEKGLLKPSERRAGEEIERVWHFRTAALLPRTARLGERLDRGPSGHEVSAGMIKACRRFNAWAEWAALEKLNPRVTLVDLTLDVAVDGMGIRQVADHRGCHQNRALRLLKLALWKYVEIGGLHAKQRTTEAA